MLCVECQLIVTKGTAWPHGTLARTYTPTGSGTAIFSCSVCQSTFVQDIAVIGRPETSQTRIFGPLRSATLLAKATEAQAV